MGQFDRNHKETLPVIKTSVCHCKNSLAWFGCSASLGQTCELTPVSSLETVYATLCRANQISEYSDSFQSRFTDTTNLFHHFHFSFVDSSALSYIFLFVCCWLIGAASVIGILFLSFQNFYQNQKCIESALKCQSQYAFILMDIVHPK